MEDDVDNTPAKSSEAQLRAAARYRQKNRLEVRVKTRERMAKLRAAVRDDHEKLVAYKLRTRAADARYRATRAFDLASRQADRRVDKFVQKFGHQAWLDRSRREDQRDM
ncbi:hypothetical protein R3P38DRAFT_2784337 [Favolaschia claudopus]|uniref:Uncharacterized protein n=1 Tax=Favolaschia claudopus TaxID=2862362 RepID=A0AAW0B086_9AGAR